MPVVGHVERDLADRILGRSAPVKAFGFEHAVHVNREPLLDGVRFLVVQRLHLHHSLAFTHYFHWPIMCISPLLGTST